MATRREKFDRLSNRMWEIAVREGRILERNKKKPHKWHGLYVDGKPFFPLGMSHPGNNEGTRQGDKLVQDAQFILDAGFNVIRTSGDWTNTPAWPDLTQSDIGRVAKLCEQSGAWLIPSLYTGDIAASVGYTMQGDSGRSLAYSIGDDFTTVRPDGTRKYPPEDMIRFADEIHEVNPGMPTYSSAGNYHGWPEEYGDALDMFSVQFYPYGSQSQPVAADYGRQAWNYRVLTNSKLAQGTPWFTHCQAFPWGNASMPDAMDMKMQPWLGIIYGAAGVLWYSYAYNDIPLPDRGDAWLWVRDSREDVNAMVPRLVRSRRELLETTPTPEQEQAQSLDYIHAAIFHEPERKTLVAVNCSRTETLVVEAPGFAKATIVPGGWLVAEEA